MSEIMRDPHHTIIDGKECAAFDDDHSLSDIVRWLMQNRPDAEEMHYLLGVALAPPTDGCGGA